MTHTSVRPARLRFHSPELSTTVLRGFGWVARCDCDERFPVRKERDQARADALRHRQEKHGGETREYAACVHRWRYFPVLDMNPEQHSRECVLCGLSQSRSGDTSLGDGLVRPGTEWKPAARVEQHR